MILSRAYGHTDLSQSLIYSLLSLESRICERLPDGHMGHKVNKCTVRTVHGQLVSRRQEEVSFLLVVQGRAYSFFFLFSSFTLLTKSIALREYSIFDYTRKKFLKDLCCTTYCTYTIYRTLIWTYVLYVRVLYTSAYYCTLYFTVWYWGLVL